MATRRPLVIVNGVVQEMVPADDLPVDCIPAITSSDVTTALGFTPLADSYAPTWASITGKPTLLVLGSSAGTASAASGTAGVSLNAAKDDHVHPHPTALQAGASIPGALMSTAVGLTATGTTQTDALALTADINYIATAAANTGVRAPTAVAGKTLIVINRGVNAVKLYPAVGANFDALAANAIITIPVNGLMEMFGTSTTQWTTIQNCLVNAGMIQGIILGINGGTGVNNSGKTLTLGGNHVNSGAFASTFTFTGTTTVTFPTTGTLSTLAGAETLTNKTLTSPVINTPTGIAKADVGLGNVDNTSDTNKPISTATQTALNAKQATLVSGSNVNTVNGNSLLGATDVVVGFRNIPPNPKNANYTVVKADAGKNIRHPATDTTARTFTVDSNANQTWDDGTAITFQNKNGAGVITIAVTTDTMRLAGVGTTGSRTLAANSIATIIWDAVAADWTISGVGLT